MKKSLSILLIIAFLIAFFLPTHALEKPSISAASYVLMEKDSFTVISGENIYQPQPPASTTKIMTCLVVLKKCDLSDTVVVPSEAVGVEGSSAYLRKGEHLTVEELLLCLMLASANDAAVALAIHTAGSVERFVMYMNDLADHLGLSSAHFTNPHGLYQEEHRISAYDMALLTAYALQNKDFSAIVSTQSTTVGKGEQQRSLTNHNRLLFTLEGCIGVKTGYTIAAGRCLVSACTNENTTLIAVTFNCHDDWVSHERLFAYGFSSVKRLYYQGYTATLPVAGTDKAVEVYAADYSLLSSPESVLDYRVYCPHLLYPPFGSGEKVGFVSLLLDGKEVARLPILTAGECPTVPHTSFLARIFRYILSLFRS